MNKCGIWQPKNWFVCLTNPHFLNDVDQKYFSLAVFVLCIKLECIIGRAGTVIMGSGNTAVIPGYGNEIS